MIRLGAQLLVTALGCLAGYVLFMEQELRVAALSRVDPLPQAQALVNEKRYAEAADHLRFFMQYDYVSENTEAVALFERINAKRESWLYQASKLVEGVLEGTSDETVGKAAGIATDFLVIGDIRDLTEQGINWSAGEKVDPVVTALSSLGILATGAQIASGGATVATGGAAAPAVVGATAAKSGVIILKAAHKLGKLPPWLGKSLVGAARAVASTKSFAALSETFIDVNKLARTRGGFHLLSESTDAVSLRRMARFAEQFGEDTATLYRLGGEVAVKAAQHTGELGKDAIKLAATYGQDGLRMLDRYGALTFAKVASRGGKALYKGNIFRLAVQLLLGMPRSVLVGLLALGAGVWMPWKRLVAGMWPRHARSVRSRAETGEANAGQGTT
jgi:hypothetical protein